jgi:hypothetical protein
MIATQVIGTALDQPVAAGIRRPALDGAICHPGAFYPICRTV